MLFTEREGVLLATKLMRIPLVGQTHREKRDTPDLSNVSVQWDVIALDVI